jgi:hypothetical protein
MKSGWRLSRLRVELCEERALPATFDVVGGAASYLAAPDVANRLTLSLGRSALLVTDLTETIFLTAAAIASGCTTDGPHTIRCPVAGVSIVEVDGAGGADTITVQQTGGSTTVNVLSAGGADLIVDDSTATTPRSAFLSGNSVTGLGAATVTFPGADIRSLTVLGGSGGNSFTVASDGPFATVLESGTGQDVVTVLRTAGPLTVNGQDGRDVISLGRAPAQVSGFPIDGKPLSNVRGPVTVRNDGSMTDLIISDGTTAGGASFDLDGQRVRSSLAPDISYSPGSLASLTIRETGGGNSFTVGATPADLPTTLTTGPGDRVTIPLAAGGPVRVIDADGSARVTGAGAPRLEHVIGRGTLQINSTTIGILSSAADSDCYTLQVGEQGNLNVRLLTPGGSALDGRLSLSGPESYLMSDDGLRIGGGGLLAQSDDRALGDSSAALSLFLLPGTYYLSVAAAGSSAGAYTLAPTFVPGPSPFADRDGPGLDVNRTQNRAVGDNPTGLVTDDFNRDGVLDLATVNRDSGDISVLLGVGDLSFEQEARFPVGGHPSAIAAKDLNDDGRLDLAVRDSEAGVVTILPGIGDGTFSVANAIRRPAGAPDVVDLFPAVPVVEVGGDFNRDGATDRAALVPLTDQGPGHFANRVETYMGLPTPFPGLIDSVLGTFRISALLAEAGKDHEELYIPARTFPPSPTRATPLFADFNGDGTADIVAVSRAGDILLRLGRPGQPGLYDPPVLVNGGGAPRARAVAVVPGGAHPRLAAVDLFSDSVSLYTLASDGVWTTTGRLATGRSPVAIASGDLDGDGLPDLVVATNLNTFASVSLYRGGTDDGFTRMPDIKLGSALSDVLLADVNHDGRPDVVVTNPDAGDVGVLLNIGGPPGAFAFADERRVRAGTGVYGVFESGASVLVNGLIREELSVASALPPLDLTVSNEETSSVAAGDFNGDGVADLVVANRSSNTVGLLLGKAGPAGGFADPITRAAAGGPAVVRVADMDGDKKLDLAVLNVDDGTVSVYRGDGRGGLTPTFTAGVGNRVSGLSVFDVNGDGVPDLAVGNDYGDVFFVLGNGDGTFRRFVRSDQRVPFVATDLNGDGVIDVVLADPSHDQAAAQVRQQGALSFTPGAFQREGGDLIGPGAVAVADLDGQYGTDLIFVNTGSNNVLVYLRRPDGGFADTPLSFFAGTSPVGLTISQLNDDNGDGVIDGRDRPDLVVANQGSNDVSVLFGSLDPEGRWTFRYGPRLATGGIGPNSVIARDQNGDGIPDLLVTNGRSGTLAVLPGVGDQGVGTGFFLDAGSQEFSLGGQSIVQTILPPGSPNGFAVTGDGSLIRFDANTLSPEEAVQGFDRFVTAVDAFVVGDTTFLAAATTEGISLLSPTAQGSYSEQGLLTDARLDDPSALTVLRSGDAFEVYVTMAGESIPLVLPLSPTLVGLTSADGGAGTVTVGNNPLALVALLTALTSVQADPVAEGSEQSPYAILGSQALAEYVVREGVITGVGDAVLARTEDRQANDPDVPRDAPPANGATELERFLTGYREALRELGRLKEQPHRDAEDGGDSEDLSEESGLPEPVSPAAHAVGPIERSHRNVISSAEIEPPTPSQRRLTSAVHPAGEASRTDSSVRDRPMPTDSSVCRLTPSDVSNPVATGRSWSTSWERGILNGLRSGLAYIVAQIAWTNIVRRNPDGRRSEDRTGLPRRARLGHGLK